MRPRNYRGQRTGVYDGLHKKREGGRARPDKRASSQTSTDTPRSRFCMRCVVEVEHSAIHPPYVGILWSNFLNPTTNLAAARRTRLSFSVRNPGRPANMEP